MRSQLHAGQLRYHDFTLLREAHRLRQHPHRRRTATLPVILSSFDDDNTKSFLFVPSFNNKTKQRSFVTLSLSNKLLNYKLKALERIANADPNNPHLQYDFLSELYQTHPEAVIERFELYPDFAVDERCAMLYLRSLERIGRLNTFDMKAFLQRLEGTTRTGSAIDPIKLQALKEMGSAKTLRTVSKPQIALQVLKVLSDAERNIIPQLSNLPPSNLPLPPPHHGTDPKTPLYVNYANKLSFQDQLWKTARWGLAAFLVVSAIGAIIDGRGMSNAIGMNGKHAREAEGTDVRFADVKGVEEAKAELEEIVSYLKDPAKFTRLGGTLPKGLLLTGPPGTGKTMLAKAIAGEASVPFFFSSGSQFEEVYVGLGAKRVRELFEAAKKKAPAIVFIDEIDAVGGSRRLKDQSAMKMTLNELLVQMDGFEENNGIIVVGATNFAQSLDPALMRPGRFDKHVTVPLPDVGGRKEILEMYAGKTKLAEDVDLDVLARGTVGSSGADLHNLMNQAALKASVEGLSSITMATLEYAKDKIMMGAERKTAVITAENARNTAFHEAGHALVAVLTSGAQPIHKATIMPRGNALGMVTQLPDGDQTSQTYKEMIARMDVCMGGRVAEELAFGKENVTSGASSDILQATRLARAMVTKFGFSEEVGVVYHEAENGASSETRAKIDMEVKKLSDEAYGRAKELLKQYKKEHHLLAETLLEYETLSGDEIRDVITNGKKPNRPVMNTRGGARGDQSIFTTKEKKSKQTSTSRLIAPVRKER